MKWILFLICFILPVNSYAARGKVLVIHANSSVHTTDSSPKNATRSFIHMTQLMGVTYDMVLGSDMEGNTNVAESLAATGDYDFAVALMCPYFTTDFDDSTEIFDSGFGHLHQWVNPEHDKSFPIPLVVPLGFKACSTGVWVDTLSTGGTLTGQVAFVDQRGGVGRTTVNYYSPNGDTITWRFPRDNYCESIVIDGDSSSSLSHFQPLITKEVASRNDVYQKSCLVWRVKSGTHETVYLRHRKSFLLTFGILLAMYCDIQPIETPFLINEFYLGAIGDTVSLGHNLNSVILPYIVANNMKVEFLVNTKALIDDNDATLNYAIDYMADYPDNFRLTHNTRASANDGGDWLGYLTERTGTQIQTAIDTSMNYASEDSRFSNVSQTRLFGAGSRYGGRSGKYITYPAESVLIALSETGVTDIYAWGTFYKVDMPPATWAYQQVQPARTWIDDNLFHVHPVAQDIFFIFRDGHDDTAKTRDSYDVYSNYTLKNQYRLTHAGWYEHAYSRQWPTDNCQYGTIAGRRNMQYSGNMYHAIMLTGGSRQGGFPVGTDSTWSNIYWCLQDLVKMHTFANNIIENQGVKDKDMFIYSWLDEVKWDRRHGNRFANSHVRKQ